MNTQIDLQEAQPMMSQRRLINAYVTEAKYAFLRFMRLPAFMIPTLLFPLFFYLLIGFVFGAFKGKSSEIDLPIYLFCGFATMSAMTPGMFGFGVGFAVDREQGLLTLKRALPMPPLAALVGSVVMSVLATFLAATVLAVVATLAGIIELPLTTLIAVLLTVALGAIPFCALGLMLGSFASGRAAPVIVNILYILLLYFSGLFIQLPKALQSVVTVSPAFYLHQLALSAAHTKNFMVVGPLTHIAVLLGVTVLCLTVSARRLTRVG